MNLRDYIGDTRTDSLPPGFLKSMKIKYKHETSHVFPRGAPSSLQGQLADHANEPSGDDGDGINEEDGKASEEVEEKGRVLPSFMSWRVPSRLLNQRPEKLRTSSEKSVNELNDQLKTTRDGMNHSRQSAEMVRSINSSCSKHSKKSELKVEEDGRVQTSSRSRPNIKDSDNVQESIQVLTSGNSKLSGQKNKEHGRLQDLSSWKQSKINEEKININSRNRTSSRPRQQVLRSKELPKLDISLPNCCQKNQVAEDKAGLLPHLKTIEERASVLEMKKQTPMKLPSSPERVDKIYKWIDKSSNREREAALKVLSTLIKSEKIKSSRLKESRIKIALQALERNKTPEASIKPLRTNDLTHNLAVMNFNKQALNNMNHSKNHQPTKREREELKTWHHLPVYTYKSAVNKSAVFIQPCKSYQPHFSILPEWGLHNNPVNVIES